ncbi:KN motif and ankyrin repeat domain-containing protein 1 [Nymphon striatum]|nr:KN motif and ankyrin repeat domain-containing protein 1 [Nymphon striatum]
MSASVIYEFCCALGSTPVYYISSRVAEHAANVSVIYENAVSPTNGNQVTNGRCDCCPYGYHIDLDFVRYCESVASGEYLRQLKELKKCRRRQRKSMEAYVNYYENRQKLPYNSEVRKMKPSPPPPPDLVTSGDSLQDAVMDFEQVLKKTMEDRSKGYSPSIRPNNLGTIDLLNNTINANILSPSDKSSSPDKSPFSPSSPFFSSKYIQSQSTNSALMSSLLSSRSRSGSQSSLDSQSTVSTVSNFGVQVNLPEKYGSALASQQMAETVASLGSVGLSRPTTPSGSSIGLNTDSLQIIRDQMASSLNKMKELEEQVKAIPILQVKISVMKEEKRLLMLQLKAKDGKYGESGDENANEVQKFSRLFDLADKGVITPRLSRRRFNLNEKQSTTDSPVKQSLTSNMSDSELINSNNVPKEPTQTRSVGINTSVLKRDVGVGIVKERSKSVGVGDDCVKDDSMLCSKCHTIRSRSSSLCTSSDIESDSEIDSKDKTSKQLNQCSTCKARSQVDKTTQGMNTESDYVEFVRQKLLEYQIHKLKQLSIEKNDQVSVEPVEISCEKCEILSAGSKSRETSPVRHHRHTSTDLHMDDVASLSYLEKYKKAHRRDRGVSPTKVKANNFAVQVSPPKIRTRDFGISVNINEKKVEPIKPVMCDKGSGTGLTSECDRCVAKKTKTVGVGFERVDHILCDRCTSVKLVTKGVGDDKIGDIFCVKCLVRTKTVGCGDDRISDNFCDKCDVLQTETVSVGSDDVNSLLCDRCSIVTTADASVGTDGPTFVDLSRSSSFEGVKLCDKCNSAIQDVAKDIVKNTDKNPETPATAKAPPAVESKTLPARFKVKLPPTSQTFFNLGFRDETSGKSKQKLKSPKKSIKKDLGSSSESDSSDTESSDSMEEASYDGLKGSITRHCDDDVVINRQAGVSLFESIAEMNREKLELSKEMNAACKVLNDHLMKPFHTRDANNVKTSSQIIQQDWFRISSQKTTNAHDVEDYLDQLEDFSKDLLNTVVNMSDSNGNTAMHYAVSYGNFDVVSLLLDSKVCDISKQNKVGYTCVMLVSLAKLRNNTDKDVVKRLLQLGDINVKAAQNGQTALMLAVSHGRLDMVTLLVDAGAAVNIQDNDGSTALMCASEHGHIEIVKYLLTYPDIDSKLVDNDGSNALGIAMEANHRDIGLLLYASISRGSSPVRMRLDI